MVYVLQGGLHKGNMAMSDGRLLLDRHDTNYSLILRVSIDCVRSARCWAGMRMHFLKESGKGGVEGHGCIASLRALWIVMIKFDSCCTLHGWKWLFDFPST